MTALAGSSRCSRDWQVTRLQKDSRLGQCSGMSPPPADRPALADRVFSVEASSDSVSARAGGADAAHQRYGKEGRHESRSDPLADEKHHDQAKRAERTK